MLNLFEQSVWYYRPEYAKIMYRKGGHINFLSSLAMCVFKIYGDVKYAKTIWPICVLVGDVITGIRPHPYENSLVP